MFQLSGFYYNSPETCKQVGKQRQQPAYSPNSPSHPPHPRRPSAPHCPAPWLEFADWALGLGFSLGFRVDCFEMLGILPPSDASRQREKQAYQHYFGARLLMQSTLHPKP